MPRRVLRDKGVAEPDSGRGCARLGTFQDVGADLVGSPLRFDVRGCFGDVGGGLAGDSLDDVALKADRP